MDKITKVVGLCLMLLDPITAMALNTPEYPAIDNNKAIQAMDLEGNFTRPFLPSHRTTADGRIAVPLIWGTYFLLNVPEKIDTPYINSLPGTDVLARKDGVINKLSFNREQIIGHAIRNGGNVGMRSICDATSQFAENTNYPTSPVSCGTPGSPADCYRFTLTTSYKEKQGSDVLVELWGRKVEVKVSHPKSASAQLVSYRWLSNPIKGLTVTLRNAAKSVSSVVAEPVFTADGRLLVTRLGKVGLTWNNGRRNISGDYNIVYAVAPVSAEPCDVRAFRAFKPITHAPYDQEMIGRYGIADYPFRDPEGNVIPDGMDLRATYPWVDRKGNNIMVETIAAQLHETPRGVVKTRFPTRCADGTTTTCNLNPTVTQVRQNGTVEWKGAKRGVTLMGRWTRGKMVLLDGLVNSTDYALDYRANRQRQIRLYRAGTGPKGNESAWVNAGVSEHNNVSLNLRNRHGIDGNLNLIDSMENLWMHRNAFRPVSFRDVVWLITSGHTTAEVALDEFIDSSAFIVSEMTPSQTHETRGVMPLWDGYNFATGEFDLERRVQNAATTTDFKVPSHGVLKGGARIEPIAMGGIEGRGVFLEAADAIEYAIPESIYRPSWVISLFIDPRFNNDNNRRRILTYPDNTRVELVGRKQLRISKNSTVFLVNIPGGALRSRAWNQIGFLIENGGSRVSVYVDGFRTQVWNKKSSDPQLFKMIGSKLTLGNAGSAGLRGWIDDFKILAHGANPEYMCNMARGTLIGLKAGASAAWLNKSQRYAASHHNALANLLPANLKFANYACFNDFSGNNQAYRDNLPQGSVDVSGALHFPEGPLHFAEARPDSSTNQFCLTCHTTNNGPGLDINALTLNRLVNMEDDPRRQPMQPPRLIFGHIPKGFVADSGMDNDQVAPADGLSLDQFIYPERETTPAPPTPTPTNDPKNGVIGDFIWVDSNENGRQDSGEVGIRRRVQLQDCNDGFKTIQTVWSGTDGHYSFENLAYGSYRIHVTKPWNFEYSPMNKGTSWQDNSDVDINGYSGCRTIDSRVRVRGGIDAGMHRR